MHTLSETGFTVSEGWHKQLKEAHRKDSLSTTRVLKSAGVAWCSHVKNVLVTFLLQ